MKPFTQFADEQLIQQYTAGNADAFGILVNRHKEKIYTSIFLLVKDKYLAEDIFQEAFIRVIKTLTGGRYKEEGKFLPFVLRIAHNLCIDHFRKIKNVPVIKTSEDYDIFEMLNFSDPSAEQDIVKSETHHNVRKMIDKLPEDQREVVILRHYADLSFKEISTLTNCSINTALGRMRYGLINLRKMITANQVAL